ncbi:MAG: SH3 domain-containing protein [Anaerolineales bacterium]|nr:SH3 domain-containing protein [Anaerolineales bacterium]
MTPKTTCILDCRGPALAGQRLEKSSRAGRLCRHTAHAAGRLAGCQPAAAGRVWRGDAAAGRWTLYFYSQNALVRVTGGLSGETAVLDIPAEVVAAYPQRSQLEQAQVRLTADTAAANVRQAPDLQAEVLGTVQNSAHLVALGRTADGSWLQIIYRGQPGWLAADLAAPSVALSLLPVVSQPVAVATDLPEAEPAAVVVEPTSTPQPQPLFCTDVPIRGLVRFGASIKRSKQPWAAPTPGRAASRPPRRQCSF